MANKPTDPQIGIKCEDCNGDGIVTSSEDRDDCDGKGHYTVDKQHRCETCDGAEFVLAKFNGEALIFGDYQESYWGESDSDATKSNMRAQCYAPSDRTKLEQWFANNAAYCAELAADARKELCGKAADEAEQILAQLHKLFAHMIDSRMPCRHLSTGVAAITMAIPDIRTDGRNRTATEADRIFVALNVD